MPEIPPAFSFVEEVIVDDMHLGLTTKVNLNEKNNFIS